MQRSALENERDLAEKHAGQALEGSHRAGDFGSGQQQPKACK
jgi:hypothetical protein